MRDRLLALLRDRVARYERLGLRDIALFLTLDDAKALVGLDTPAPAGDAEAPPPACFAADDLGDAADAADAGAPVSGRAA